MGQVKGSINPRTHFLHHSPLLLLEDHVLMPGRVTDEPAEEGEGEPLLLAKDMNHHLLHHDVGPHLRWQEEQERVLLRTKEL